MRGRERQKSPLLTHRTTLFNHPSAKFGGSQKTRAPRLASFVLSPALFFFCPVPAGIPAAPRCPVLAISMSESPFGIPGFRYSVMPLRWLSTSRRYLGEQDSFYSARILFGRPKKRRHPCRRRSFQPTSLLIIYLPAKLQQIFEIHKDFAKIIKFICSF